MVSSRSGTDRLPACSLACPSLLLCCHLSTLPPVCSSFLLCLPCRCHTSFFIQSPTWGNLYSCPAPALLPFKLILLMLHQVLHAVLSMLYTVQRLLQTSGAPGQPWQVGHTKANEMAHIECRSRSAVCARLCPRQHAPSQASKQQLAAAASDVAETAGGVAILAAGGVLKLEPLQAWRTQVCTPA